MSPALYKPFLYLHIIAGSCALVSGLFPLATEKGGKIHRLFGKVFFIAMWCVGFSALIISVFKDNRFLLAIAVFSMYMNYTGYRALKNRTAKYKWFDWLALVPSLAMAVYMISTLNIVLIVFGALLAWMCTGDAVKQLKGEESIKKLRRQKVLTHIARMVGAYIAASTAFLVVNVNNVNPSWLPWLLPTALGTPFIIYWSAQWRKKLKLT